MPRTQREMIIRRVEQSTAALEKCISYLLDARGRYDPDYPEYVEAIDLIITVLDQAHGLVEAFREIV